MWFQYLHFAKSSYYEINGWVTGVVALKLDFFVVFFFARKCLKCLLQSFVMNIQGLKLPCLKLIDL